MKMIFLYSFLFLIISINGDECDFGCQCVENVLDCTDMGFSSVPKFKQKLILSTESLLLKMMPKLQLSTFMIEE